MANTTESKNMNEPSPTPETHEPVADATDIDELDALMAHFEERLEQTQQQQHLGQEREQDRHPSRMSGSPQRAVDGDVFTTEAHAESISIAITRIYDGTGEGNISQSYMVENAATSQDHGNRLAEEQHDHQYNGPEPELYVPFMGIPSIYALSAHPLPCSPAVEERTAPDLPALAQAAVVQSVPPQLPPPPVRAQSPPAQTPEPQLSPQRNPPRMATQMPHYTAIKTDPKKPNPTPTARTTRSKRTNGRRSNAPRRPPAEKKPRKTPALPRNSSLPHNGSKKLWCVCRQPDDGDHMVACDARPECETQWFHFDCVGLERVPRGEWFCEEHRDGGMGGRGMTRKRKGGGREGMEMKRGRSRKE